MIEVPDYRGMADAARLMLSYFTFRDALEESATRKATSVRYFMRGGSKLRAVQPDGSQYFYRPSTGTWDIETGAQIGLDPDTWFELDEYRATDIFGCKPMVVATKAGPEHANF